LINKDDICNEIIRVYDLQYDMDINSITFDGNWLIVDLQEDMGMRFNIGSSGSSAMMMIFYETLFDFEEIEYIKVLVGGEEDSNSDHYSFQGIKTRDGRIYIDEKK